VIQNLAEGTAFIDNINAADFEEIALSLFLYQYGQNKLYRDFTDALHIRPASVTSLDKIPFLPISFFKTHRIVSGPPFDAALVFESSGTTGEVTSKHFVKDAALYEASLLKGFEQFYGAPQDYAILALLPSYLERSNASLVHMARQLMAYSGHPDCGFYLNEWDTLSNVLLRLQQAGQRVILLGVTFALLDFAEAFPMQLNNTIVMETGGMKGRREEWTRNQVHQYLQQQWQLPHVHSEYGMTELLSQAYALKDGLFQPAATMKVLVRDINDPLSTFTEGTGCINVIDLANRDSCAFIATEDIARLQADGHFEVLGRMDHSALRGCSLMTA
jgi:phenylacetate-coenzyme A ligase PaaK-like adenylate-forming protein